MITPKENLQLVFEHKQPEFMPLKEDFDLCYPHGQNFINERPEVAGINKDWFDQSWTFEPSVNAANPTPGFHLFSDITTWEDNIVFPNLDKLDWEYYVKKDTANWDRDRKMSSLRNLFGMFERLFSVMDFTDVLIALMEEPEACSAFFSAVADHKIRLFERMIDYYNPDIIIMHDDYGNHQGLFMQPSVWRALL
ncbi:uroporphyrinogen decarboxylase/cobalamine-independent methonine synthase family protein [Alkalibacter mobilis]|uniref:hypothetical protein n=1 Tax=Alkalibacter mobilis TaxID=2787712 RepID=UPI00189EA0AC|nr:hypothetical protein [Alkalibacter mobilis]MBF7097785.1 hypothetical protein [Alkalibacter mobilis]